MTKGAAEKSRATAAPAALSISVEPRLLDRKETRWLLLLGLLFVAGSLLVRVIHRGQYIAGWDLVAPTQGHFLASTRSVWGALTETFHQNRHYWLPFSAYSAPFSLIPGYLGRVWPWQYWVHILTFLSFFITLMVILRAADLPLSNGGILLLAWGASPMLLSYAVTGYPWASAFLPHALALWITMSRRFRSRWVLTLLWCLVANELAWHVYELGKTVGVVFLAAALLQRDVPRSARAVWLLAGMAQLADVLFLHPTANIKAFAFQAGGGWEPMRPSLTGVARGLQAMAEGLFVRDGKRMDPVDLPILFSVGILSFFFFKRDRWFLLVLFLIQLGLVVVLAMYGPGLLRPRRFIMVAGYCLVCIACMYREATPLPRWALVGLLLLGSLWQGADLLRFVRVPFPRMSYGFTMPYVNSREGVGLVDFAAVDWSHELRTRVEGGKQLLLLYNFDCYAENFTNPTGVLERLYLSLGHEQFVRSVLIFGKQPCRYCCLPIRPLSEFGPFLDGVRPDGPTPPSTLTGYYDQQCRVMGSDAREPDTMFAAIRQRFRIGPESLFIDRFFRFKIEGLMTDEHAPVGWQP
jgi:hypothetical protein